LQILPFVKRPAGGNLVIGDSEQNLVQSTLGATLASKFYVPHDDGSLDTLRQPRFLRWQRDDPSRDPLSRILWESPRSAAPWLHWLR
jgi:hypothetical protein